MGTRQGLKAGVRIVILRAAKNLGRWGVTPPQMLRRFTPQHDIRGRASIVTYVPTSAQWTDTWRFCVAIAAVDQT
jgi:hypothetical protein